MRKKAKLLVIIVLIGFVIGAGYEILTSENIPVKYEYPTEDR